jgi:hypothetical protein
VQRALGDTPHPDNTLPDNTPRNGQPRVLNVPCLPPEGLWTATYFVFGAGFADALAPVVAELAGN